MNLPSSLLRDKNLRLEELRITDTGRDGSGRQDYHEVPRAKAMADVAMAQQSDTQQLLRHGDGITGGRWSDRWHLARIIGATAFVSSLTYLLGRSHGTLTVIGQSNADTVASTRHVRRQQDGRPACGGDGVGDQEYDLPLHVGALFIILFVSSTACAFPMLSLKFPRLRIPRSFLFVVQHFGTGVLLATTFAHLLPTAFVSLGDPCLSDFWTTDYQAMPGAIALGAIFLVVLVEMIFSPGRHTHHMQTYNAHDETSSLHTRASANDGTDARGNAEQGGAFATRGNLQGRATSLGRGLTEAGMEASRENEVPLDSLDATATRAGKGMSLEQETKRAVLQCTMLEMGILFHSIFIGMSLSVTLGNSFVVYLIAIIFHQTCEGLALGARIAHVPWKAHAKQPWLMAVAYGCTTPLGQALGLATHQLYDPSSAVGLLVVGIFNALSAGLLCFSSLVELLSEDFLSDESWKILKGRNRALAFGLVFAGAFAMSLIGAWA